MEIRIRIVLGALWRGEHKKTAIMQDLWAQPNENKSTMQHTNCHCSVLLTTIYLMKTQKRHKNWYDEMPRSTVIVGQCRHRLITDSRLIYANSRLCNNFIKCASSNNKERKLRNKMVYLFMIFVASVQSPNLRPPQPHSAPSTQQHALSLTIAQWMQHTIVCFAVWQAREKNSISLTNPNKFKIITRKVIQLSKFVKVVRADNRQLK